MWNWPSSRFTCYNVERIDICYREQKVNDEGNQIVCQVASKHITPILINNY